MCLHLLLRLLLHLHLLLHLILRLLLHLLVQFDRLLASSSSIRDPVCDKVVCSATLQQ